MVLEVPYCRGKQVGAQSGGSCLGTGHNVQGKGGGLQNGKTAGPKLYAPPSLKTG